MFSSYICSVLAWHRDCLSADQWWHQRGWGCGVGCGSRSWGTCCCLSWLTWHATSALATASSQVCVCVCSWWLHAITCLLTHLLTTHSLTHSPTHAPTWSLLISFSVCLSMHSSICPSVQLWLHAFSHSFHHLLSFIWNVVSIVARPPSCSKSHACLLLEQPLCRILSVMTIWSVWHHAFVWANSTCCCDLCIRAFWNASEHTRHTGMHGWPIPCWFP